ncbi:MAG: BMP family ABC transporter substrate-binding protein [Candidatus Limnocylindria bacterium]
MKRFLAVLVVAGLVASACGTIPGLGGAKVGMVTDIGQLEDKSFNEFSWEGVQEGARRIGGSAQVIVTRDTADYAQNIQTFVDQDYDVIVTVGFLIGSDTMTAAQANPDVQFFGVDQFVDPATAPPNYQGLLFNEAQAGYLAGLVAATISESGMIGAVGGRSDVPPVVAYIEGYEKAAKSVNPSIEVIVDYTEDFNAPDKGEASARTMIGQGVDVIFQVAGLTGAGALRAACSAGIWGIGVDVDQYESLPDAQDCIVTSAEKKLLEATASAIVRWREEGPQTENFINDASNDGIGYSPIRNLDPIPAGLEDMLQKALEDMKSGALDPTN